MLMSAPAAPSRNAAISRSSSPQKKGSSERQARPAASLSHEGSM
jgi:hypothetical protein